MKTNQISNPVILILLCMTSHALKAQNQVSQTTQTEAGISYVLPFLQSGKELMHATDLRSQGASYFQDSNGKRRNAGKYSSLKGYSFHIAFYKPLKKVKGLMLGAAVRNSQTGSQPSTGGYEEGYFFNFITAGVAIKYYPFTGNNFFIKGDAGLAAVLTKSRFINESNEQNFFHQFGIGSGGSVGAGYSLTPFRNKLKSIDLQIIYQQLSTRVEVNGIGDDQWKFGAVHFGASINM